MGSRKPAMEIKIATALRSLECILALKSSTSALRSLATDPLCDVPEAFLKSFPGSSPDQDSLTQNGAILWGEVNWQETLRSKLQGFEIPMCAFDLPLELEESIKVSRSQLQKLVQDG